MIDPPILGSFAYYIMVEQWLMMLVENLGERLANCWQTSWKNGYYIESWHHGCFDPSSHCVAVVVNKGVMGQMDMSNAPAAVIHCQKWYCQGCYWCECVAVDWQNQDCWIEHEMMDAIHGKWSPFIKSIIDTLQWFVVHLPDRLAHVLG